MAPLFCKCYHEPVSFARALGVSYEALVNGPYKFDAFDAWKRLSERVSQGIYMGEGLLLPHTRIAGLPAPLMAFSVASQGFSDISVPRQESAKFMCVLLSPAESAMAHTQTIAKMAALLLDKEWKARALACTDDAQVAALFSE